MPELTNDYMALNSERYIANPAIKKWNQSIYFNFFDKARETGAFIRIGILENIGEVNSFAIFFRNGKPLFTRLNMNLPYTAERMDPGIEVAGLRIEAIEPLQKSRVRVTTDDFSADLVYDLIHPMGDSIAMNKEGEDAIARELCYVHLEGVCRVKGVITLRDGEKIQIDTKGFRDISVGPRNWAGLIHYRLAWPIFDNGMACVAVHGISESGHSYQKILTDGKKWISIDRVEEKIDFEADDLGFKFVHWKVWDETGRLWDFTGKPLFRWQFPWDTFVMVEQMMEYRLADGTLGYGMGEGGFRFPFVSNGN
jgi:hypothetical protein